MMMETDEREKRRRKERGRKKKKKKTTNEKKRVKIVENGRPMFTRVNYPHRKYTKNLSRFLSSLPVLKFRLLDSTPEGEFDWKISFPFFCERERRYISESAVTRLMRADSRRQRAMNRVHAPRSDKCPRRARITLFCPLSVFFIPLPRIILTG